MQHGVVLQLLWDELPITFDTSISFLKEVEKDKVNNEYPPDALCGLDLYTAVTQYIQSSSKEKAKLFIIDNLIKSNRITDHHWAVTITNWLINTFVVGETKVVKETSKPTKLPPLPSSVTEFNHKCNTQYLAVNNTIVPPNISMDELNKCISDCKIEIGITDEIELPSFYKNSGKELAFHLFPYLPNLQVSEENDNIIVNNIENSKLPVIIISPSGMGKTGLMIRSLSKYPGIYICAAHVDEFVRPIAQDMASVTFLTKIGKTEDRFATIRQLCQLLLITKMLHVIEILKNVTTEQIDSFQGSLLSLLSFNQFNGKTDIEATIFDILISKQYHYCDINRLRDISASLIQTILVKLKDFNINSEKFIICVDESNLFEKSYQRFFSINGRDSGILSALAIEIRIISTLVSSSTSIFAGTSFDIDISSVIRSGMGKTELTQDYMKLYIFQYLDMNQFIDFMQVHNVKYSTDQLNACKHWFPMRRRQALYFLHQMLDSNEIMLDDQFKISSAFENSEYKMKEYIQEKCISFEERMAASKDVYLQSFKVALMKYVMHFKYPELLGSTFIVKDGQVAKTLLMSGITCPSSENELHFYAIDTLDFCVQSLYKMNFPFSDNPQTISSQLLTFSDREEILEPVIGIALTSLDLTLNELIASTQYKLQQNVTPILNCKVKCKRVFNSSSFYLYCKDNNWIDHSIEKYSGEQLFFHFIGKEDYQKIDGIALFPSDYNHTDIYLFYLANNIPVHFRISVKSLTTRNDLEMDQVYKSLAPELMYLEGYQEVELDTLDLLRKNEKYLNVVDNFITTVNKSNVKKAEQELKNLTKYESSSSNEELEVISNIIENDDDDRVESTTNEMLESVTELDNDIMVNNIKKSIHNKLDEWWRSNRAQVWSSIQKGISLNVIIHLHPNKEPKILSKCYSNIICIGEKSFSTLFPYLSNNVETFLQNQLDNMSKQKNMQN